jgi:hypothetical protein
MNFFWEMPKKFGHQSPKPLFENNHKLLTKFFNMVQLGNDQKNWAKTHKKSHCINGGNQTNVDPMIKFFYQEIEKHIRVTTKKIQSPNLTIESF